MRAIRRHPNSFPWCSTVVASITPLLGSHSPNLAMLRNTLNRRQYDVCNSPGSCLRQKPASWSPNLGRDMFCFGRLGLWTLDSRASITQRWLFKVQRAGTQIYVYVHVYVSVYKYVYAHEYVYVYAYIRMYIHVCVMCTSICIRIYVYVKMHTMQNRGQLATKSGFAILVGEPTLSEAKARSEYPDRFCGEWLCHCGAVSLELRQSDFHCTAGTLWAQTLWGSILLGKVVS